MLRASALVWLGLLGAACGRLTPQADLHPIAGQNVLLITIDTLRADALGSYGGPAATPELDRLAKDGVRFDFAHAHAVLTLPSHASILTGLYPFQHGIRDNSGYRLPPDTRTAARLVKDAGYATAAFVGAFPLHSRFGLNQGFDVYDDRVGETRAPTEFTMPERPAAQVVALARAWITARTVAGGSWRPGGPGGPGRDVRPWFTWVHLFDPHAPYRPPPPFDAQYEGRPYYGEVAATDAALAPLLDDVRASGRPTLVVVTGDHGEALGDHGEASHGLFAYESTLRIPLIVAELGPERGARTSAQSAGGEVSSVPARHVDILPTILDAIGQPIPADLPGRTLLPAAERHGATASVRASYFEAMGATVNRGWAPLSGVLLDRDKLIDLPILERYDLRADPGERSNLAGRVRERDRELEASLRGYRAAPPGERVAEDPDAASLLQALGYVSGHAVAKARYSEADDPKRLVDLDRAVHQAVEAFGGGRAQEAQQIYEQIIGRRPDMAIAYRHLAFVKRQLGNLDGAVDVLQRAVKAGITQAGLLADLCADLTDSGRVAQGIQLLEPLAGDPHADADTLNTLAIAYARGGRPSEAGRLFERVLAINPESSVPLENLGVLALERGDLAAAQQRFASAVGIDPRSSRAHSGLGAVAQRGGNRQVAIEEWTRAVQLDRTNFDALYNLGVTLAMAGQMGAARPYLEEFLRTAPPSAYAPDLKEARRLLTRG
jgi:arylsulfatase A-like enzyme/Tfp pilus assembly protein PilF